MARGWQRWTGALLLLYGPLAAPAAHAQAAADMPALPFVLETITDRSAAELLVRRRLLVKSWFFPRELGGPDSPENVAYITPQATRARAALIKRLARLLERDVIDRMDVQADYKGASIIPSRIRFKAWHSRGGETVEAVVEVW